MKKTLLLLAINAAIFSMAQAQDDLPPSPPQTGNFVEKNFDGIVRYRATNQDSTGEAGFYATLSNGEVFRIRLRNDSTFFETSNVWHFTPALPGGGECCLPDTPALNYITLTNCPAISNSRPGFITYNPQNAQISSSSCDTITISLDSLFSNYISVNGSSINSFIKGTPNEILYYGADSLITSDSNFYRTDTSTFIINGSYGILVGKNNYLPVTEGVGFIYPNPDNLNFMGIDREEGEVTGKIINVSKAGKVHSFEADSNRVTIYSKTVITETVPVSGVVVAEADSSVSFEFSNEKYFFPKSIGNTGFSLTSDGNSPSQLYWKNTPSVTSGTGAPATTPVKVGDIYVDTSGKKIYFATGTTNSSDWTITN